MTTTPYAHVRYSGDGSTTIFNVPFPYLERSHVKALVDGENVTFTWVSAGQVSLDVAPPVGTDNLRIYRETPSAVPTFSAPSSFSPSVLNVAFRQLLYVTQEAYDKSVEAGETGLEILAMMEQLDEQIIQAQLLLDALEDYEQYYLGSFTSHPTGSFVVGAEYYNRTDHLKYIWNGTSWEPTVPRAVVDVFSGTGSQSTFTLSQVPNDIKTVSVLVDGQPQKKSTYSSLVGNVFTLTAAPPAGTDNVEITYGTAMTPTVVGNWKSAWTSSTPYVPRDVVSYGGSTYICLVAHTNHTPAVGTYWDLVASKGDQGIQGPVGVGALLAARNLSDLLDPAAARENLGLGSAATTATSAYATAAQGNKADTALQPSTAIGINPGQIRPLWAEIKS